MAKIATDPVIFQWHTIYPTPRSKKYVCPYCSWRWKTEKWIMNHDCSLSPVWIQKRKDAEEESRIRQEKKDAEDYAKKSVFIAEWLKKYPIWSKVFVSSYVVTKPTHVWNEFFGRMQRKRYEEERRYFSKEVEVKSIDARLTYSGWSILINWEYREDELFPTLQDAQNDSEIRWKWYRESCDFASMCR